MAKAFVCDMTGSVVQDVNPVRVVEVKVGNVELLVRAYVRVDEKTRREADLGEAAAAQIKNALERLQKGAKA